MKNINDVAILCLSRRKKSISSFYCVENSFQILQCLDIDKWKRKSNLQTTVFTRCEPFLYLKIQSLFQVKQNLSEMAQYSFNFLLMEPFIESLMYSWSEVVLFRIISQVSPLLGNYSYNYCSVSIKMKEIHIQFLLCWKLMLHKVHEYCVNAKPLHVLLLFL